jgi:UPF0755 protein
MRILATLSSLFTLAVGALGVLAWQELTTPVTLTTPVVIEVSQGASPRTVARQLEERGVVRSAHVLLALARLNGSDKRIRFGHHEFSGEITVEDALAELEKTPVKPSVKATILEGWSWRQTAAYLESEGIVTAKDYEAAVCDPVFLRKAGAAETANCAEGFLFPDTYHLEEGVDAKGIAQLQLSRFAEIYRELSRERPIPKELLKDEPNAAELRQRIVTLASIVEKETGGTSEQPRVAGVFLNRLRIGMRLQTDPTVIYGIVFEGADWDGNLRRADLTTDTPYNTYVHGGIPPGPITNPGRSALRAVFEPEDTKFLYFVAKGGGEHQFSRNLREHNAAVRKFQLAKP